MSLIVYSQNDTVFDVVCSLLTTRQFIKVTWKLSIMLKGAHWTHQHIATLVAWSLAPSIVLVDTMVCAQ